MPHRDYPYSQSICRTLLGLSLLLFGLNAWALNLSPEEQAFIQNHPTVIVGGETDWPPFDYVEDGKYTGAAKDYLDELSRITGLKFDVVTGYTWNELLSKIQTKEIDLLPMLYWSEERTNFVHYTRSYLTIRQYVFQPKGASPVSSMDDLAKLRLAVPKGYAQVEILSKRYPEMQIIELPSPLDAMDAVITGKADVMIENTALVSHLARENNIHGLVASMPTDFGINELYMGARADKPLLRDILQKGLDAMSLANKHKIASKWLQIEKQKMQLEVSFSHQEINYLHDKQSIKTCVDPDWTPLEKLEQGKYTGAGADYLALFSEKLGIPIEVVPTKTWAQSKRYAKARKCDMFMMSSDSASRQTYMDVSTPYVELPLVIATRNDVLFLTDVRQAQGKRIGIVDSYALWEQLESAYPDLTFVGVPSREEGLQQVVHGELFGFVDTVSAIGHAIDQDFFGELKVAGKFDINWELGVATRNDEPLLGSIFEKVIASVPNAERERILQQWISMDSQHRPDYTLIIQIVAVALLLLGFLLYRNLKLVQYQSAITLKNQELDDLNQQLLNKQDQISYMAYHDALTGLPNKTYLSDRAEHALRIAKRHDQQVALLFIDLDRFKTVNDTLGHSVGDELLKAVAKVLLTGVRDTDTLARIGGDEFVLLIENVDTLNDVVVIANNLIHMLEGVFEIGEYRLNTTASIGIAIFPNDGKSVVSLMKNADSAMYAAKDAGKNRYQFYTSDLSSHITRRVFLEDEIRKAIEHDQFTLVYQPKLDLQTLEVIGAETLIRWNHPDQGFISPAEFIPVAEDSGLIVEIGEWVFEQACRQMADWVSRGTYLKNLAINVASAQLAHAEVASVFNHFVKEHGLDASNFEIEITEHSFVENTQQNIETMHNLRKLGFRIAVDDFGTGYSSMGYLKAMPLSVIKIDKSFVDAIPEDENNMQISSAIIALSHSLGFEVVAEGIETKAQEAFLREQGCDYAQGYLYGKPMVAAEFEQFLKSSR